MSNDKILQILSNRAIDFVKTIKTNYKNKRLKFIWCVLITSAFYQNVSLAEDQNKLVISYRLDSAPIQFKNNNGEADGILIDYWKLWSGKSGIPVEFKGGYNKQALVMIVNNQADINAGIFSNESRKQYLDFSDPILKSSYYLFLHKSLNHDISLKNNFKGLKVGVTLGSFHESYMRKNYPQVNLSLYDGYQSLFSAAEKGDIKIFISQRMYRTFYLKSNSLVESFRLTDKTLYTHSYKAAVGKGNANLLTTINQFMLQIKSSEKADITRKWLGLEWYSEDRGTEHKVILNAEEKNWLSKHKVIHMGGESDWPPFDFVDDKGRYQGIASDYVRHLETVLGIQIKMHYKQPWAETLNKLKKGELDAIVAISKTAEREKFAHYTTPYVVYPYVIVTNKKNSGLIKLKQLEGKVVAVERGFYTQTVLNSQYPGIRLLITDTTEQAILAVVDGEAVAYIGVQPVASYYFEKNMITNLRIAGVTSIKKVGISMAAKADSPVLFQILQKGLDSITTSEKLAIQRKWMGLEVDHTKNIFTKKQKQWMHSIKSISIGIDPGWPPIEYVNNKGVYSGIASDYVEEFEKVSLLKLKYDTALSWSEVMQKVKNGEIDMLPAVSKTPEREKYLSFTEPYLAFPYVLFTRNDAGFITGLDDLLDKTIVAEKNYTNHEILKKRHPAIKLILVDNTEQALMMVSLGKADAYMGNLAAASHIIMQTGLTNIKVAAPTPYSNDLSFAVRKDLTELTEISQIILDSISVEKANEFKRKWFSISYEHHVDYSLVWKVMALALLCLFIFGLWLWMVNKQKEILRVSEERFRLVMKATQEGIWDWDIVNDTVYYSPGFYKMLGFTEKEFTIQNKSWAEYLHADDYDMVTSTLHQIVDQRITRYTLEFRLKHIDGKYRNVVAIGTLVADSHKNAVRSLGSLIDITDKKQVEKTLKENEIQLKRIIDTIPLAIVILDDEGEIIFSNRQTEKEIGSNQSVTGLNLIDFYEDPKDRDKMLSIYRKKGAIESLPIRFKTLSGGITEGIISMLPIYFDGVARNLGLLVNLTQRIQMERELVAAKTQADIANKTKSAFLANMSHEIRTPMNAIIGLGHLALKTNLTEKQRDYIDKISVSSHSLLGIINDILDFSKIEAGKLEIDNIEFQLDDVIENVSSLVALNAEGKGIEVVFSIAPEVPLNLLGDPLRLGQVLINLTQNAIKFTDTGGVLVDVSQCENLNDKTRLKVSVLDTGIGISEKDIPYLFDAFSQVDETYSSRFEGTGLGLAICHQLVDLMGGDIRVESVVGKGSRFSFEIIFGIVNWQEKTDALISFSSTRALIINDNIAVQEMYVSMFDSYSFKSTSVSSVMLAVDIIKQNAGDPDKQFDLLLIDRDMSAITDVEIVQTIRNDADIKHHPVIVMLAPYSQEEIARETESAGIDALITKPVTSTRLFKAVGQAEQGMMIENNMPGSLFPEKRLTGEILLVEDNAINQQVAQEMLENMGLFVSVVDSAKDALEMLALHDYNLLLTDIQMPEMDGYELVHEIRKNSKWQSMPVIAMTAHAMKQDREKCLNAGMNSHIPKPIDPDMLFSTLAYWLKPALDTGMQLAESQSNTVSLPIGLPSIDVQWSLRRLGGNMNLLSKLLKEFVEDYVAADEKVNDAISSHDFERAQRLVHTIQGVSGSIGAKKLYAASADIEVVLKNKAIPSKKINEVFQNAFKEVMDGLNNWLKSQSIDSVNDIKQKNIPSKALLDEIVNLLKIGSLNAEELIASLDKSSLDLQQIKIVDELLMSVENYDFSYAQTLVLKLSNLIKL